jgi:carbonic anhydrase
VKSSESYVSIKVEGFVEQDVPVTEIEQLLLNNKTWASKMIGENPAFFQRLEAQQAPGYLWIGCSDSRVPATQLVDLPPGEMFVHRNVANVVVQTDLNCLAVLQFAVEVLRVRHIIVCGHYGCGGVEAALNNRQLGLIDNWLRHVQSVRNTHRERFAACADDAHRLRRLCELNVIEQVVNVCQTTVVESAWQRNQTLTVHGWIYGLGNGILRDVMMTVAQPQDLQIRYSEALLGLT